MAFVNLFDRPSFELTSGTVEVRRNYATDPAAISATTFGAYLAGTGETGTTEHLVGQIDGPVLSDGVTKLTSYARRTVTTPKTTGSSGWRASTTAQRNALALAVAGTATQSMYFRYTGTGTLTGTLRLEVYNGAGTSVQTVDAGPVTLVSGAWTRVPVSITATAVGATIGWWFFSGSAQIAPAGSTIDATGVQLEPGLTMLPFLYGAYSPERDTVPTWTGAPNASPSTATALGVTGATIGPGRVSSTLWAKSGARSLRLLAGTPYADLGGGSGAVRLGLEPGKTYTAIGTARLEAPQTGGSRRFEAYTKVGAAAYVTTASPSAPNVAGEHELRVVFTVPVGATEAFLRVVNGSTVGDVWFDDVTLVEGNYTGPAFHGDTPDVAPWRYWWAGTANDSVSYRSEMTVTVTPQPSIGAVRIELAGGEPGTPLYVLRRGGGAATGIVRETSEGTVVWPALGQTVVLTDYEATQGTNTMYIVTDGDGAPIVSATVMVPLWGTWLKSPGRPFRNTRVRYVSDTGVKLSARRLIVDIEGAAQRVVFAQNRANPSGTVTLLTLTAAEAKALELLVSDGMTVLLDTPPTWGVPFRYVSVGDVGPERAYDFAGLRLDAQARAWILTDVVEVEAPQGVPVGDPGRTYADVPALFATYVAIPATTDTYERLGTGEE